MKHLAALLLLGGLAFSSCSCPVEKTDSCSGECLSKKEAVYENIMTRRSVRKYKPEAVDRAQMDTIMKCGINAPNGMNRQSYEVRVVDSKEFIDGITEAYRKAYPDAASAPDFKNVFRNAPTVAFIAYDEKYDLAQVDCGLLGANMIHSAWSMGIGSCCLGGIVRFMEEDKTAKGYLEKLGFSEGYKLLYAIGFGYPDETPAAKPRKADKAVFVDFE